MISYCNSPTVRLVMALLCCFSALASLFASEIGMPTFVRIRMTSAAVLDTQAKFDTAIGVVRTMESTLILFNLTNAHAMQTVTPPPKPIFQEVPITLTIQTQNFDYELSADASVYTYKTWSYTTTKNASDANLVIVQANMVLPAVLMKFGGEATIKQMHDAAVAAATAFGMTVSPTDPTSYAAACAALNPATVQLCMQASLLYVALLGETFMPLRPDGTRATNMGLFVRHTVDEMLHGYFDPLIQTQTTGTTGATTPGRNVYPTLEELKAALASGVEPPAKWQSSKKTGRDKPEDVGKWHAVNGLTNLSTSAYLDQTLPIWLPRTTGYNNIGDMTSPGRDPFVIEGLRTSVNPTSAIDHVPSVLSAGFPPKVAPSAGAQLSYFDEPRLMREVTYSCTDSCDHEMLHGTLNVVKYHMDESNARLNKGGKLDSIGSCAWTLPSSCDFGSTMSGAWNTAAGTWSLPYFGHMSSAVVSSVSFKDATGADLAYDDATMRNEMFIEPFSGAPVKVRSAFQFNLPTINGAIFNGNLYANVFSGPMPLLFPVSVVRVDFELDAKDSNEAASGLNLSYMIMIALYVNAISCICSCLFCLNKANSLRRVAPPEQSSTNKTNPCTVDEKKGISA